MAGHALPGGTLPPPVWDIAWVPGSGAPREGRGLGRALPFQNVDFPTFSGPAYALPPIAAQDPHLQSVCLPFSGVTAPPPKAGTGFGTWPRMEDPGEVTGLTLTEGLGCLYRGRGSLSRWLLSGVRGPVLGLPWPWSRPAQPVPPPQVCLLSAPALPELWGFASPVPLVPLPMGLRRRAGINTCARHRLHWQLLEMTVKKLQCKHTSGGPWRWPGTPAPGLGEPPLRPHSSRGQRFATAEWEETPMMTWETEAGRRLLSIISHPPCRPHEPTSQSC